MNDVAKLEDTNVIKEKIKLDKAYLNYHEIIDKKLEYKFSYLDEWLLKESKLLLKESTELEQYKLDSENRTHYRTYPRGTIIKVDFGVNLGSEMSQVHFAIVLNNYDSKKNNVLTVVPLTSKENKYNLDLGPLILDVFVDKIKEELISLGVKEENEEQLIYTPENQVKAKKLSTLLSYYQSNKKNTYACCGLVTTISKGRILPPINEYDIVGRKKCPVELLDKIDKEIIERFTKKVDK